MYKKILGYINHPDTVYLKDQGKYKALGQVIVLVLSFILTWFLANYTSKEFFGRYQLILALFAFMIVFSFIGIKDSIIQSTARGYEYSFVYGTKKAIKFSLIGSVMLMLIGAYYFFVKNDAGISIALLVCSALFPLFYTLDNFNVYLEGKRKFREGLICSTMITVTKVIAIFLSVLIFKENIVMIISVFLLSHISLYAYFFYKYKSKIKSRKVDPRFISYGWFITKISFLSTITGKIDKVLVGLFIGPVPLAVYSIGTIIPEKAREFVKSVFSTFIPKFATKEMIATWKKVVILFILGIMTSIALIMLFPIFIKIAFKNYQDSIIYGQIYSLSIIFAYVNSYMEYLFRSMRIEEAVYKPFLISNLSYFFFMIILTYLYGMVGLIISIIIKQMVSSAFFLLEFKKHYKYLTALE